MNEKNFESKYDRILKHYKDPEKYPLTEKEEDILKRWKAINDMLRAGKPKTSIITIIKQEYGVKLATAYNDIKDAQLFFAPIQKAEKEYYRTLLVEWAIDTLFKAKRDNNLREENQAIRNLTELLGLKHEDSEIPDPSKLGGNVYQMVLHLDNSNKAVILNLDKPETIPGELRTRLMEALRPQQHSTEELLKMLSQPKEE